MRKYKDSRTTHFGIDIQVHNLCKNVILHHAGCRDTRVSNKLLIVKHIYNWDNMRKKNTLEKYKCFVTTKNIST